jgi:hypothetical protein
MQTIEFLLKLQWRRREQSRSYCCTAPLRSDEHAKQLWVPRSDALQAQVRRQRMSSYGLPPVQPLSATNVATKIFESGASP